MQYLIWSASSLARPQLRPRIGASHAVSSQLPLIPNLPPPATSAEAVQTPWGQHLRWEKGVFIDRAQSLPGTEAEHRLCALGRGDAIHSTTGWPRSAGDHTRLIGYANLISLFILVVTFINRLSFFLAFFKCTRRYFV